MVSLALFGDPALAHHPMGGVTPTNFTHGLLSGLGHPIIGFDHLAAIVAVGCLAATQSRGALVASAYVIAMLAGAAVHVQAVTVPATEVFVALSVIALGSMLIFRRPAAAGVALALFAIAGLVHGYALGESIVGAEPAPLYAYFTGLALIHSAMAIAIMALVRQLIAWRQIEAFRVQFVGAAILGIGLAGLAQQLVPGA